MNVSELYRVTYNVFHPFIGLLSWKRHTIISAIQHSLNVAAIACDIAALLTNNGDEIDIATYGGLFHDLYQKSGSAHLKREDVKPLIEHALNVEGLDGNIIKRILDSCNYNVAENPEIWSTSQYRVAAASMRLADMIASAENAFNIIREVEAEKAKNGVMKDIIDKLDFAILAVYIPQPALRSLIYHLAAEKIAGQGKEHVIILARDGAVIVSSKELGIKWPIEIEYSDIKNVISLKVGDIADRIHSGKVKNETKLELFAIDSADELLPLDETTDFLLSGIKLVGITQKRGSRKCLICGMPSAEEFRPTIYGYAKYKEAATERWSPKYPAGENLNILLQRWRGKGVCICPLCVLEALTQWRAVAQADQNRSDYSVQFFFTEPSHYRVARDLSTLAKKIVSRNLETTHEDLLKLLKEPQVILRELKSSESYYDPFILIDFTWSALILLIEGGEKEREDFARFLPNISKAIILTGIYPAKFTRIPDPVIERRLILPVHPLYDYDVNVYGSMVPLTLFAIAAIKELYEKGKEERIMLDYLNYPYWMVEDLLMKSSTGREVLRARDEFAKNPCNFLFKK
jgi:hypothetical protein